MRSPRRSGRRAGRAGSAARPAPAPTSFLLVTQYFRPERGAAQVRLGAVIDQLVRRGRRVEVITSLPNYPVGRIFDGWSHRPLQAASEDGARVIRVWVWASMGRGAGRMLNYLSFGVASVLGLVAARPADWTIVEYPTLFGALPTVAWSRLRRRRVVLFVADLWVDSIVQTGTLPAGGAVDALLRAERWMLRACDAVTAVTEGTRDAILAKGVDPAKLAWLPNGVDVDVFAPGDPDPGLREELGLADGEHLFLYAGTHGYVHGLGVVLDAAAELRDLPVRFLLVGGGSEKPELQRQAAERGLTNVDFHDPVAPEEVARLLRASTAGLATVMEGEIYRTVRSAKMFPTMAAGRPVLYSGHGEGADIVERTGSGVVTPPGDGVALAAAVRELVADPDRAAALGAAGRAWVVEHMSWNQLVGTWLDRLAEIAGTAPEDGSSDDAPVSGRLIT